MIEIDIGNNISGEFSAVSQKNCKLSLFLEANFGFLNLSFVFESFQKSRGNYPLWRRS